MGTHAKLSPSSRHRWQLCPASVRACAQYKEGTSSPASIDGTRSHFLLEQCFKHAAPGTVDDPEKFLGTIFTDEYGKFSVAKDRVDRVRVATDYIRERIAHLGEGTVVRSERHVDPMPLTGRKDLGGTVDVTLSNDGFLEVIDYKDGMGQVDVVNNPQLEQYVVGVLSEQLFSVVRMTIVQPKLAVVRQPTITHHEQFASDFLAGDGVIQRLRKEAEATDAPDAPFVPGEKQCQWCPHAGQCQAAQTHVLKAAGISFADLTVAKDAANTEPTTMTDEQLRELVEAGPLLRKMLEAAEAEALDRIKSGHPVAGLKVIKGTGRRGWGPDEEVVAEKLIKMGLPKGTVWKTSLISPTQLESVKWTKRDGTVKQLSPRQTEIINTELVVKSEGKLTVVPESDRRQAVEFGNIKEMFSPVEPDQTPSWLS